MPYILPEDRDDYSVNCLTPPTTGHLNYQLTQVVKKYLDQFGMSYATVNSIVGALECCKLELYRRIAAPYEDTKIVANGDVY